MQKLYTLIISCFIGYASSAQPWQVMQDIPVDLAFPVVVELRGNIHVIGGGGPGGATDLHLRYTPSTDTWDTLPPVPYMAQQPAGAVVNDKIHFCGGGFPTSGQRLDYHYYYDPDSVQWYQAANLPVAVAIHKAVALDGKLFVLTGQPDKFLCEYYDPSNNTWYPRNPLPDQDFWYGAIVSTSNAIYRFGGGGFIGYTDASHQYDPVTDYWTALPNLPFALHAVSGAAINDTLICLAGGYTLGYETAKVWIYNTNTQVYYPSDSLPIARDYHSMVIVDSCLFSVGGNNAAVSGVGLSLIKNCAPSIITSIQPVVNLEKKPYTVTVTPSEMQIQLSPSYLNSSAAIKMVDLSGRTISSENFRNGSMTIHGNTFAPGLYIVLLVIGNSNYVEEWVVGAK